MSGDVQPRKRKDKKRKKDELGIEEPRGTAAVFGEGDVFMHSQHDHGTGGHWCAKIIFFSLLAVLIALIGLIILENRGLSELEANAVESRYSGVLEGWLEDAPDDDHHDEHTLELTHDDDDDGHEEHAIYGEPSSLEEEHDTHDEDDHGDEDDAHSDEDGDHDDEDNDQLEQDDEDQGDEEDDAPSHEDDDESNYEDADEDDHLDHDDSQEQDQEKDEEDEDEEPLQDTYEEDDDEKTQQSYEDDNNDLEQEDEDDNDEDEDDINNNEIDRNESNENFEEDGSQDHEEDEEHEEEDDHSNEDLEVEKLEKEIPEDLEPVSTELPALPEEDDDDDDDDNKDEDQSDEKEPEEEEDSGIEDEEEFLEADDDADEPPVEKITVPAGKPFDEVEDEVSSEQPPDTLEEEEEYEKQQEELRREEAQASHMWLKLGVGAALLVATHAVLRRATHSRDTQESAESASREETPVVDRRLTLIPEEPVVPVRKVEEISRPVIERQVVEKVAPIMKSIPIQKQESEEEEEEKQASEDEEEVMVEKPTDDKELYSEEEADEEIEEEEEEEIVPPKKETTKLQAPVVIKKPEPVPEPDPEEDEEDPDDVEIIGDEQLEEELEEEGDEEEISDVDDVELLSRLEAKYGKLPEPERPGPRQSKREDGGNSIEDMWPGEPSDAYWRQQLDSAERELRQGSWSAAAERAGGAGLRESARARFVLARALDLSAEAQRDNRLLSRAIGAYLDLLKMNERLSDKKLLEIAARAVDRIQFRGNYLNAEPVYRLLIRRFPNEPAYRNNLTISFLMANRVDLAEEALKETLSRWPNDRVALAHYGFVLKTKHNKYEEAAEAFKKALEGDTGPANEPRFYYHFGDSLMLLGRLDEARAAHERGAKLGHFLSPSQRSLYNVDRLKSTPWWDVEKTPYLRLAKALEKSWKKILREGEAAKASYEEEKEGLKKRGEWSQLDLFVRGQEIPERCARAPVTCSVVKSEPAAAGCRRGQIKFSLMAAGTHVRAHVGPTNCRLRMHLGLSNTKDTYIRVDKEIRQWQLGKVLMFDDSFEHEVWHNGTGARLVLIVDVWHPHLTAQERRRLPAI